MSKNKQSNFDRLQWLTGRGTIIPMSWQKAGLTGREFAVAMSVLNVTTAQTNPEKNDVAGKARIAASTIAEATGFDAKNVSRSLRALEDKGCITKIWQGNAKTGLSNVYMVNDPPLAPEAVEANRQALADRMAGTAITDDSGEEATGINLDDREVTTITDDSGTGINADTTGINPDTTGINLDTTGINTDTTGINLDVPSESSSEYVSESKSESFSEELKLGDQLTTTTTSPNGLSKGGRLNGLSNVGRLEGPVEEVVLSYGYAEDVARKVASIMGRPTDQPTYAEQDQFPSQDHIYDELCRGSLVPQRTLDAVPIEILSLCVFDNVEEVAQILYKAKAA